MVKILSRKRIEGLLSSGKSIKNYAVISFCDKDLVPVNYSGKTNSVFTILLDDISKDELKDYGIAYEQFFKEVDALAEFIYKAKNDGLNLLVQCEFGQSRSSACAAAILEHFYKSGITIFTNYNYCPNLLIYHKVFDALERYGARIRDLV